MMFLDPLTVWNSVNLYDRRTGISCIAFEPYRYWMTDKKLFLDMCSDPPVTSLAEQHWLKSDITQNKYNG
jgi:hypothetical protein